MHLHGHEYQILAEGHGTWGGVITNPNNPARRDVHILPSAKLDLFGPSSPPYMVILFEADNPGVWPFHCHIAWHVSAGLYVNILERPDDIKNYNIPPAMSEMCKNWGDYAIKNVVNQIDSGLRNVCVHGDC
ncbi:hypothetical protein EG328_009682 [Venturia inaequalis]|uniref:Plastocyanin-like domain-containing protein n=1 Tax=Venturia inaequalis TaxID=5025 RepID=A0A8H3VKJ6_VENIN|nr:hypothetical protein EG328_009682 [Venturia inaequalis]